jgi:hemerythrin-like domain-containing protein
VPAGTLRTYVTPGLGCRLYTVSMPVQIGVTTHSFDDPTALLSDCHRRVEMFMGSLEAVASRCADPLTDDVRRSLDLALRYFREAAPKHTADEEESLFPRLRQISTPEMSAALHQLDTLEGDHRWAEPLHEAVDTIGNEYLRDGILPAPRAETFQASVAALAEMYRRHIQVEDEQVFPVATRLMSAAEKSSVAREMAERRNVKLTQL